jgi:hypothetical protein
MTTTTKRGRPRLDATDRHPSVYTHLTLPARLYDKAYADARRARMTLPEWIRHTLRQTPAPPDFPDRR